MVDDQTAKKVDNGIATWFIHTGLIGTTTKIVVRASRYDYGIGYARPLQYQSL